jgi:hypothetical protein
MKMALCTPETLYTINTNNAALTLVQALGNGTDGEAIAYNSGDGMMYHMSGIGAGLIFEKIHLSTGTVTNIPLSGDPVGGREAIGFVYDPATDIFYGSLFDWSNEILSFVSITPTGVLDIIAPAAFAWKDYIFYDFSIEPPQPDAEPRCSAAPFPVICSMPDVSGDGLADVGVAIEGSVNVHIRDSATDAVVNDIDFGADPGYAVEMIGDINGNDAPEIAVLSLRASGQVVVTVRDSLTDAIINTIFYGTAYAPLDMTVLPDSDGNGAAELAVMGVDAGGGVRVQARDALSDVATSTTFYGNNATARDVQVIPDINSNGNPEIAVHTRVNHSSQGRVQLRDSNTVEFIHQIFFGTAYVPLKIAVIDDVTGDGIPEIAQLAQRDDTGAVRIQVKNPVDKQTVSNAYTGTTDRPVEIVGTGGMVGLLVEDAGGVAKVIKRDALTGAFIGNVFMGAIGTPEALVVIDDLDASGDPEFAALGNNAGQRVIQIKDSVSGAQINNINLP